MKAFQFVIVFVFAFLVFHFVICGMVHFVTWEANYFNIGDWHMATRFFWLVFGSFISFSVACLVVDS